MKWIYIFFLLYFTVSTLSYCGSVELCSLLLDAVHCVVWQDHFRLVWDVALFFFLFHLGGGHKR